ncbi:MAG: hypothetical protein AAF632_24490 [Bacteroidota bacterium]
MPNDYDKIIRENIEAIILPLAGRLFELDIKSMEEVPDELQVTLERKPDFLKRITTRDNQNAILHIEFQSTNDGGMVYRMLEYYALLLRKHRSPIIQFVVYLGREKPMMDTTWSAINIDFQYTLRSLRDYDYQNLVASDVPEEVILAVLSDFQDQPPEEIIRLILEKIVQVAPDELKLQRYLRQLGVLSKLRSLQPLTLEKIDNMPIEYDIQTDYLFMKGKEAGIKEGVKEGMAEGMREGKREGKKEGKEEEQTKVVVNMLKSKRLTHAQIAEFTGIAEKRIKQIAQGHNL